MTQAALVWQPKTQNDTKTNLSLNNEGNESTDMLVSPYFVKKLDN